MELYLTGCLITIPLLFVGFYYVTLPVISLWGIVGMGIGICIAYFFSNPFMLLVSFFLSLWLPKYVNWKKQYLARKKLLFSISNPLKLWIGKLIDFPSIMRALEEAIPDMEGGMKKIFREFLYDLQMGFTVEMAFEELQRKIQLQRFQDFLEKLLVAEQQGFHAKSLRSLKETVNHISEDCTILKELERSGKSELKRLYFIATMSWFIPYNLSGLTERSFMHAWYGQLYLTLFLLLTIWALLKGDQYASLNLEDL